MQRITSDEEERRRAGFRIVTSYRFQDHGDRPGRLDAIVSDASGTRVARLAYGDSADVHRINLGPARRPEGEADGFWLDPVTGAWLTARQAAQPDGQQANGDADDTPARQRTRVIPYVRDRRNILVFQLATPVMIDTALSFMYALERGIEAAFQLEDSELDGELLPPDEGPRDRILFTESAEGGAGVLRRMQAEQDALDLVDEETLPKLGHSTYRADFGIPSLGILIEVKYVRKSSDFKEIEKQVLEDSVAYLNGVTAYKEIVVFIYDESASVQEHDTTSSSLRGVDRISDVIIVSRPSQLARPNLRRKHADTAKPARQTARE